MARDAVDPGATAGSPAGGTTSIGFVPEGEDDHHTVGVGGAGRRGRLDDSAAVVVARLRRRARAPEPTARSGVSGLAERCVWSLVWLGVVSGGFQLWGSWSAWSFGGLASPLLVLAGIVGLAAVWLVASPRSPVIQVSALVAVVAVDAGQRGDRDPRPPLLQHGLGCLQPGGGPAL